MGADVIHLSIPLEFNTDLWPTAKARVNDGTRRRALPRAPCWWLRREMFPTGGIDLDADPAQFRFCEGNHVICVGATGTDVRGPGGGTSSGSDRRVQQLRNRHRCRRAGRDHGGAGHPDMLHEHQVRRRAPGALPRSRRPHVDEHRDQLRRRRHIRPGGAPLPCPRGPMTLTMVGTVIEPDSLTTWALRGKTYSDGFGRINVQGRCRPWRGPFRSGLGARSPGGSGAIQVGVEDAGVGRCSSGRGGRVPRAGSPAAAARPTARAESLVIRGEAGMGKTALLAYAAHRAGGGSFLILSARGVQSESELAFAGLVGLWPATSWPLLDTGSPTLSVRPPEQPSRSRAGSVAGSPSRVYAAFLSFARG